MRRVGDRQAVVAGVLLVVITAGTYLPCVLWNGFVNYDDPTYVTANPHVTSGLTWANVQWAFASLAYFWHPLTWLSHMADWEVYGNGAWGHHLTSVGLHTGNSLLLFILFRRMTGAVWRSFFAAAFFAVHPLHVESVAWVAERKDVLSTFFFMLTLITYERYAEGGPRSAVSGPRSAPKAFGAGGLRSVVGGQWYVAALVFFALGLMAKTMIVTLPIVLLLLDFWPLRRLALLNPKSEIVKAGPPSIILHLHQALRGNSSILLEKLPFLALSLAAGILTILAQGQSEAIKAATELPLGQRLENAVLSCATYLWQTMWPSGLAVFYSYWMKIPLWLVIVLGLGGCAISLGVFRAARLEHRPQTTDHGPWSGPWLLFGWAWYLLTLLPAIGIIQVGSQAHADRYTYIPLIGVFVAVVWSVAEWAGKSSRTASSSASTRVISGSFLIFPRLAVVSVAAAVLVACAVLTIRQLGYWRESEALFRHALAVTGPNGIAHIELGTALEAKARALQNDVQRSQDPAQRSAMQAQAARLKDEAMDEFAQAVRISPGSLVGQCDLCSALAWKGRLGEAIEHGRRAIQISPKYAGAQMVLGVALGQAGHLDEAIEHLQIAVQLAPKDPDALYNLAFALLTNGQTNRATVMLRESIRLRKEMGPYRR